MTTYDGRAASFVPGKEVRLIFIAISIFVTFNGHYYKSLLGT